MGNKLASGLDSGTVHLWDVETGTVFGFALEGHIAPINAIALL